MPLFYQNTDTTGQVICDSCENIQLPLKVFFSFPPQLFSPEQGVFSSSTNLPKSKILGSELGVPEFSCIGCPHVVTTQKAQRF